MVLPSSTRPLVAVSFCSPQLLWESVVAPSPCDFPCHCRVSPQAQGLQFTLRDLTPQAQGLVEVVRGVGQRWSASHVVDVFRGSQSQAVRTWAPG